jgi:hypothetical protein
MTYCIGFRKGPLACLIADAAVTGPHPSIEGQTSFGELQINDGVSSVSERALKIFRLPMAAVTFSGLDGVGRDFVEQLSTRLTAGMSVAEAFEASVANVLPLNSPSDLQVICAWPTPTGGRLLSFNAALNQRVSEHEHLVQIGSADRERRQITERFLNFLGQIPQLTPVQSMVAMTALCQSYGVYDYTLPRGIGGAFTAISTGPDGIQWQPNTMYIFYRPEDLSGSIKSQSAAAPSNLQGGPTMPTVFACVHHDVLVLRSSVADGGLRLLANSFEGEPRERALARAEAASRYALQVVSGEGADYLAFLCTAFRSITLCETLGHPSQRHLVQRPSLSNEFDVVGSMSISPELAGQMCERGPGNGWFGFRFRSYDPIYPPENGNACPCGSGLDFTNCHGQ